MRMIRVDFQPRGPVKVQPRGVGLEASLTARTISGSKPALTGPLRAGGQARQAGQAGG